MMPSKSLIQNPKKEEAAIYEAPAVIYEGELGVRAGSTFIAPGQTEPVDPSDLFNNDK